MSRGVFVAACTTLRTFEAFVRSEPVLHFHVNDLLPCGKGRVHVVPGCPKRSRDFTGRYLPTAIAGWSLEKCWTINGSESHARRWTRATEGGRRLQTGASMRSTDRDATRDGVYAADKRCTRARVITVEHVDGAVRVGLASLPRTRFLGRLEFLAAREERIPSSFLREGHIKSQSLSSPLPSQPVSTDNNTAGSFAILSLSTCPCAPLAPFNRDEGWKVL